MEWIYLSVIHSIIVAGLILFLRYDDTPSNVFPIITNIIVGSTVQKNIGLDKQYYSGIYEVNWNPTKYSKINFKLLDFEYVNNQNISNYFNVYKNSYDKLNFLESLNT